MEDGPTLRNDKEATLSANSSSSGKREHVTHGRNTDSGAEARWPRHGLLGQKRLSLRRLGRSDSEGAPILTWGDADFFEESATHHFVATESAALRNIVKPTR